MPERDTKLRSIDLALRAYGDDMKNLGLPNLTSDREIQLSDQIKAKKHILMRQNGNGSLSEED